MRQKLGRLLATFGAALASLAACASPPPPPHAPAPAAEEAEPEEPEHHVESVHVEATERARPASSATYEEALSTPEQLDVHDDRVHLTDGQLTGPMRSVLTGCRVPPNARITIKTAVQNGRAIGVSIDVRFESSSRSARPPSRAAKAAQAKMAAKIVTCVDRNVRAVVWPPSRRRDSFTTEF
ncbi:MAG: hypothetical protein KF819_18200 [Labilithrix sp.]|nr:hypothetical protein [Labilithrix sp.]